MSDQPRVAIVHTRAERRRRISLIWAIPAVTALIAAWLAWDTWSSRGPRIDIRFDAAAGLQVNQSRIRHRDVVLGVVEKIALTPDRRYVLVTARMAREAEPLLTDKTAFWIVKPRFSAGSISGLETLFSGAYIELEVSGDGGEQVRQFVGLEDPPILRSTVPGHTYQLKSKRVGSLNPGSPILFRDLEVGQILGWDIGAMASDVTIHAFVRAPYDRYVHTGSVFWNASGATLQLSGNGLKFQIDSPRALVLGGVAFETTERAEDTPVAREAHPFDLYADRDAAEAASFGRSVKFVTWFAGSVAGLRVGAPVTLHGIRIGAVTGVALSYDPGTDDVSVAVRYEIEPDRIARRDLPLGDGLDRAMRDLVAKGLRVSLESGSLLTGSKQLTMEIVPNAPEAALGKIGDTFVLPRIDGDTGDLAASAASLVQRLHAIPFEQIGDNLNKALAGANGTINDPKLRQALAALTDTLTAARALIVSLDKGMGPVLKRLPELAADLDRTVKHAGNLAASLDDTRGPGTQLGRDVARLMAQLTDAARSIRLLADTLNRHPEALIRGRADQEPR